MMDRQKLIDKLMMKYPKLEKDPLFDELIGMDEEGMGDEMDMEPSVEIDIKSGEGEEEMDDEMKAEEEKAFGKMMYKGEDEEEPKDPEEAMLKEAANTDKTLPERLREKLKAKKYFSK